MGGRDLIAFRINDELICRYFLDEVMKLTMENAPKTKYLPKLYDIWANELQFMIYNTPDSGDDSKTKSFYNIMGEGDLLRNFCRDIDKNTYFDYIIPFPFFIKKGVVFLQYIPIEGVSTQSITFDATDRDKVNINSNVDSFKNYLGPKLILKSIDVSS